MRKIHLALLLCFVSFAAMAQGGKELQLEDVVKNKFKVENVYGVVPMNDGVHYTQKNAEGTQIIKYSFKTGKPVEVIFDVDKARDCNFKSFDSYTFSPDGTKILIATETSQIYRRSYTAVHYVYTISRNVVEVLSENGPQQAPVFSPDGHMVAFVRSNNIYLVKFLYNNSESAVTTDGKFNEILNGIPDWVYEEEFSFNSALEFSADSKMLAYIKFDESAVKSYSLPMYAGQAPHYQQYENYPGDYTYKYPKTGEENSKVSVHTFDVKTQVTRKLDIPLDEDGYIPRIRFTNDSDKLAVMTMNRHQNRLEVYFANPKSTVVKLVLREESKYYIEESALDNIKFYDNNFSVVSERDGFAHLYWYSLNGNLIKQVTKGDFEVTDFLGWSAKDNTFYYESNEGNSAEKGVYKVDKKGVKTLLTTKKGVNSAIFSSNMDYFMNKYTSFTSPMEVTLNNNKGKVLHTLVDNKELLAQVKEYNLPQKEMFSFETSNGTELKGWMMKPANFDVSKKYPVLLYQYSGPGSQQVVNRWGISWETYMATQGYIVACVDGRGTGGRGEEFKKCTYLYLGVKEAEDQVETAKYLGKQTYVDADRIGIWGWSFGGYTTIMSMSEGTPVFKAGVAVAPVTDWKYYDTIYGERFMRTPKENFDGYEATSAFTRADKLHGNLLIVHGLNDDNVHYQNVAEYSECLVQKNIPFDMHVYTNRNHGIYGGNTRMHLYGKITNYFKRNL